MERNSFSSCRSPCPGSASDEDMGKGSLGLLVPALLSFSLRGLSVLYLRHKQFEEAGTLPLDPCSTFLGLSQYLSRKG